MISSPSNPKIKYVRSLARRRTRYQEERFIVEGLRLFDEVVRAESWPELVLFTQEAGSDPRAANLLDVLRHQGVPCYPVTDKVMAVCSDTEAPPGLLAVLPFVPWGIPKGLTWALVCGGMRNPGNLGAILRAAAAAGVQMVWLTPGTVDPYNPKAVRAGAGAHFCLPFASLSWEELEARLAGWDVWLAAAGGAQPYQAVDWTRPVALAVGGEAEGADPRLANLATGRVRIPMERGIESLNVAVAAGIILFEIARQRRGGIGEKK